jgi:hypothetical protein
MAHASSAVAAGTSINRGGAERSSPSRVYRRGNLVSTVEDRT